MHAPTFCAARGQPEPPAGDPDALASRNFVRKPLPGLVCCTLLKKIEPHAALFVFCLGRLSCFLYWTLLATDPLSAFIGDCNILHIRYFMQKKHI